MILELEIPQTQYREYSGDESIGSTADVRTDIFEGQQQRDLDVQILEQTVAFRLESVDVGFDHFYMQQVYIWIARDGNEDLELMV